MPREREIVGRQSECGVELQRGAARDDRGVAIGESGRAISERQRMPAHVQDGVGCRACDPRRTRRRGQTVDGEIAGGTERQAQRRAAGRQRPYARRHIVCDRGVTLLRDDRRRLGCRRREKCE
jgi:hypothetical protein